MTTLIDNLGNAGVFSAKIDVIEDAKSAVQGESPWSNLTPEQVQRRYEFATAQLVRCLDEGKVELAIFYEGAAREALDVLFPTTVELSLVV